MVDGLFFFDMKKKFEQVFDASEFDARNETGLAKIFEWQEDFLNMVLFGGLDDINNALNGAYLAI